ncbi:hypothetical protein AVEN_98840-1 [Araneus ventricosus]|uniref:Uncharacterized protein n=1 Tax=Araneus ventricosus TaxID=182803 RepID=A0A4Y2MW25_ARAVE|nr:hypothetical protein AVEN_98840-1 [Araneus ventricosus]
MTRSLRPLHTMPSSNFRETAGWISYACSRRKQVRGRREPPRPILNETQAVNEERFCLNSDLANICLTSKIRWGDSSIRQLTALKFFSPFPPALK